MATASAKTVSSRPAKSESTQPIEVPSVVTVFRALDGSIHHTRCKQRMAFRGTSAAGMEIEFHCATCHERVVLPYFVAARLPLTSTEPA
jgi:hypothetical protein